MTYPEVVAIKRSFGQVEPPPQRPAALPLVMTAAVAAFFSFLILGGITQVIGEEKTRRRRFG